MIPTTGCFQKDVKGIKKTNNDKYGLTFCGGVNGIGIIDYPCIVFKEKEGKSVFFLEVRNFQSLVVFFLMLWI